jgi:hypothetical protein
MKYYYDYIYVYIYHMYKYTHTHTQVHNHTYMLVHMNICTLSSRTLCVVVDIYHMHTCKHV